MFRREKYNEFNEKPNLLQTQYWMEAPVLLSSDLKKKLLKINLHGRDVAGDSVLALRGETPEFVPQEHGGMPDFSDPVSLEEDQKFKAMCYNISSWRAA